MLEYAYKLKSFNLLQGLISVESIEDLFENFILILSKRVLDRNRKGLYCGYVQKTESVHQLIGQIKMLPTAISILKGSSKATCRYEEHTSDLIENQIILWTLYQLRRFEFKRDEVKNFARKAYRELFYKVSLEDIQPCDCINRLYNRLNEDYESLHCLCRFFLEQMGPGIEQGAYDFIPFVLNMPNLFQSFVAEWLKENLPKEYHVSKQYTVPLDSTGLFEFRIDIIITNVKTKEVLCVLDTKYKRLPKPLEHDICQIHTYAAKIGTKNAVLVYPTATTRLESQIGNITVRSAVFDISQDPDSAGYAFIEELQKYLQ